MNNKLINDVTDMINLYKEKEVENKTNLLIYIEENNPNQRVISINYGDNYFNKTEFSTENSEEFDNKTIFELINHFKKDEYFKEDNINFVNEFKCTYQCIFNSGRKIILENVSFFLINTVKSLLTGQVYQISNFQKNKKENSIQNGGFSNHLLLTVTLFLILDVILVMFLWVKYMI